MSLRRKSFLPWLPPEAFAFVGAILIVVLVMTGGRAHAQAASAPVFVKCHPKSTLTPWGTGTDYITVETDKATGRFGWCPQGVLADGTIPWSMVGFTVKLKNKTAPTGWSLEAAIERVHAASSPASAVDAEIAALRVPAADEWEQYELNRLYFEACKKLRTAPYPIIPGTLGWTPPGPTPAACVAPTPPTVPVPVEKWTVVKSGTATTRPAYLVSSAGARGAANGTATVGATCDCVTRKFVEVSFGVSITYCAAPPNILTGATSAPHVTACVKAP